VSISVPQLSTERVGISLKSISGIKGRLNDCHERVIRLGRDKIENKNIEMLFTDRVSILKKKNSPIGEFFFFSLDIN
jgi:hypothetical protein